MLVGTGRRQISSYGIANYEKWRKMKEKVARSKEVYFRRNYFHIKKRRHKKKLLRDCGKCYRL